MEHPPSETIYFKRSRFSSRLPVDRLYTPAHYWLKRMESADAAGLWRVGFTKFATRMLGDLVEHGFNVPIGERVAVGQTIGWVEGFKALTDLYCVADGEFAGANPALDDDVTLTDTDPYGNGWLYAVRGIPDPNAVDVHGYIQMLDLVIDKMQGKTEAGAAEAAPAEPEGLGTER